MRRYRKEDIETHSERYGGSRPAVNVKVYHFDHQLKVVDHFKCSEEVAEQALNFVFTFAQERFWEDAPEWASEIFGSHVKVYSEGRSGGWLVVHNLPPIEEWNAIMVSKWARFEKMVKSEIEYCTAWEQVREDIECNEWAQDDAEQFNFIDTAQGVRTVAELNAHLAQARAVFMAGK